MFSIMNSYLDNGLRVMLRRVSNTKTLSCGIWINQGVKDEETSENGISHLIEHLMFKTNSNIVNENITEIMNKLKEIGAKFNASTTKDYTCFFVDGLVKDFDIILEALAALVANKEKINEEFLEKEKEIVLREAEGYLNSTRQIAERVNQALWGDRSYGQLVIGKSEVIKKLESNKLNSIIEKNYIPENSVLVIVGGIDYEPALKKVKEIFIKWEDKIKEVKKPVVESNPGVFINSKFGGQRSTIGIGFTAFPILDQRSYYVELLKDLIASPFSDLFNVLREEKGLVYSISGFSTALTYSGSIGLAFTANNDKATKILEICLNYLKKITKNGFFDSELQKVKRRRETSLLYAIESTSTQLQTIGAFAIRGMLFSVEDYLRLIYKAKVEQINNISKNIFISENMSLAVLGSIDVDKIIPLLDF